MTRYFFILLFASVLLISCSNDNGKGTEDEDNPDTEQGGSASAMIGSFYSHNGIEGIVYKVTDGGKHGMVVSLDEFLGKWATKNETTGATDMDNGAVNMACIKSMENWEKTYPVFKWCDTKNTNNKINWYIPSLNELQDFWTVWFPNADRFNQTLTDHGGVHILPYAYGSSTESRLSYHGYVYLGTGEASSGIRGWYKKINQIRYRAVCAF